MATGERFDGYALEKRIGAGGMAEVFRAKRVGALGIHREVCIKRIRRELCGDRAFTEMFADEARIATALRHPNIVSVEHFGEHAGTPYMAMEWVHGVNLAELLRKLTDGNRTMPTWAACFVLAEVLRGLGYAHTKLDAQGRWLQIVHRDVSPHNVMVSFAGEVKLTDFGIAKATSRLHHTAGAVIKGKIAYLAPEQATSGTLDGRTDLFALGVSAYEMFAGCLPHQGSEPGQVLLAMLSAQRRPLTELRPDLDATLVAFVERLLAVDASARFTTAEAARQALEGVVPLHLGARALRQLLRELYAGSEFSTLQGVGDAPAAVAVAAPRTDDEATAPDKPRFQTSAEATKAARPAVNPLALDATQPAVPAALVKPAPLGVPVLPCPPTRVATQVPLPQPAPYPSPVFAAPAVPHITTTVVPVPRALRAGTQAATVDNTPGPIPVVRSESLRAPRLTRRMLVAGGAVAALALFVAAGLGALAGAAIVAEANTPATQPPRDMPRNARYVGPPRVSDADRGRADAAVAVLDAALAATSTSERDGSVAGVAARESDGGASLAGVRDRAARSGVQLGDGVRQSAAARRTVQPSGDISADPRRMR